MNQFLTHTLAAIECTPWCRDGDGHVNALHPEDQACISEEHIVELTTEPLIRFAGASTHLATPETYLLREPDDGTNVELSKGDVPVASLTLDEALELGRILTGMALAARR
jgi:hypothetical protein